jgi:hypothetical protein
MQAGLDPNVVEIVLDKELGCVDGYCATADTFSGSAYCLLMTVC